MKIFIRENKKRRVYELVDEKGERIRNAYASKIVISSEVGQTPYVDIRFCLPEVGSRTDHIMSKFDEFSKAEQGLNDN